MSIGDRSALDFVIAFNAMVLVLNEVVLESGRLGDAVTKRSRRV
jgi:hypothetical protein